MLRVLTEALLLLYIQKLLLDLSNKHISISLPRYLELTPWPLAHPWNLAVPFVVHLHFPNVHMKGKAFRKRYSKLRIDGRVYSKFGEYSLRVWNLDYR